MGSILAISDEVGNALEQRHYDAWGVITHVKIGTGSIITDPLTINNLQLIIDRGYTSHEHFNEVGIIHMNGRLYDPLLRRFLNADENIQDPHNTQNYNKYGYVMNNPLMYNDPNGEIFFLIPLVGYFWSAVIVGAAIGLASYTIGLAVTGNLYQWNLGGALKSMFWGAVSGAVTFGIGNAFTPAAGTVLTTTEKFFSGLAQGLVHGFSQGVLSVFQGGDFLQGFASGALGSWAASGFGAIAGDWAGKAGGQIFFGALSGGVGAELTGGNFWQGAIVGGIVAGLNHTLHSGDMEPDNGYDKNGKKINNNGGNTTDYMYDENGNVIASTDVKRVRLTNELAKPSRSYGYDYYQGGGALYDPSWDIAITEIGGGLVFKGLGLGLKYFNTMTGGIKQWIRTGSSYSIEGGFKTYSTRWGAGGNYWKKIGNPTLQNWNRSFRQTKLPGNNWRVQDPGHFHWWKK